MVGSPAAPTSPAKFTSTRGSVGFGPLRFATNASDTAVTLASLPPRRNAADPAPGAVTACVGACFLISTSTVASPKESQWSDASAETSGELPVPRYPGRKKLHHRRRESVLSPGRLFVLLPGSSNVHFVATLASSHRRRSARLERKESWCTLRRRLTVASMTTPPSSPHAPGLPGRGDASFVGSLDGASSRAAPLPSASSPGADEPPE